MERRGFILAAIAIVCTASVIIVTIILGTRYSLRVNAQEVEVRNVCIQHGGNPIKVQDYSRYTCIQ